MKRIYLLTVFILGVVLSTEAQCYCEDCPEPIINGAPSTASLTVSGISNGTLGQNGQGLINVGVYFTHDAAQELSLRLVAPNGSFVDLTIGEGLDFGQNNFFDINFVQCSDSPVPDCDNNATWTSADEWDGGPYLGSYYPESGCLEDLTGDVNGTWTLELEDVFVVEDGELYCFDLTFADAAGAMCNESGCSTPECLVQGGSAQSPNIVTAPEGDPALLIDYTITYDDCEIEITDPNYLFIYIIYEVGTNTMLEIQQGTVDMTGYEAGSYIAQGFSILSSDLSIVEPLVNSMESIFEVFNLITNGDLCADNTELAGQVFIDNCAIDFTGSIEFDNIEAEAGDPLLDPTWNITWMPAAPDWSVYGLYYVVYDQSTGVIVEYLTDDDFTNLPAGDYHVAVLVYHLSEEPNLPVVDGVSVYIDIVNAIIADELCAIIFGNNQLFISEPCTIDAAGILEQEDITAEQNSPLLDPEWDISFAGDPPDPALYGFYFVVVNLDTDLLVAYYTTDNFTLLLEGNYYVTVVYYLLDDQQVLPPPNGTNTFLDLVNLINSNELCAQYFGYNVLEILPQCEADAGTFPITDIEGCEGDEGLILDLTPEYPFGGPDPLEYGYTYVVSQGGIIINIDNSEDFTGYALGEYQICGLSYLLTDEGSLPSPNGTITTFDIQDDIDNGLYCAELTMDCITLTIGESPMPVFTGPTEVCAGEEVEYTVENFSGNNLDYLYTINQGGFLQFINDEMGTLSVIWASGPGNICVTEFQNGCEEQVCLTIDVISQPEVTITGNTIVCPNDVLVYTFDPVPTGAEFYDVVVTGGTISSQSGNTVTIEWDNTATGSLLVTLAGGACDSEPTLLDIIKIDVDFPTPAIPDEICLNESLSFQEFEDPNIVDVVWTATNADIDIDFFGTVTFTWIDVGPAEICLEIFTDCGQELQCFPINVIQSPEPTSDQVGMVTCSYTFTLEGIPSTGTSWMWSAPGLDNCVVFSNPNDLVTEVTATCGPGVYWFLFEEWNDDCQGQIQIPVTVLEGLDLSEPMYECDSDGFYTVSFSILNGSAPYAVDGIPIGSNVFTSAPIASGESYSFIISDDNSCEELLEGSHICPCITDAGTMVLDLLTGCISSEDELQGIHNSDQVFDADDVGTYVLHTSSSGSLGTVLSENSTGLFGFDPSTMIAGEIYYISFIAGNPLNDVVDLADPCLSVAEGQPIVFYNDPIADAGEDASSCSFVYDLTSNAGSFGGIWSVVDQPDGSIVDFQVIGLETSVIVDAAGTYVFELEYSENGCSDTDQVVITFLEGPMISVLSTSCDGSFYTVSFDISGGTAPYFINGEEIDNTSFTSGSIPSGVNYEFTVIDAAGCSSDLIVGTETCNCITDAGTMSQVGIELCAIEGELIVSTFNDDATFDADDGGIFVLHTASSNILGTVLATSENGEFIYTSSFGSGETLYISYVVGNSDGTSVDFDDECLSVSVGQPVELIPLVQIDAGVYDVFCELSFDLDAESMGITGMWAVIDAPVGADWIIENVMDPQSGFETNLFGTYELVWTPIDASCVVGDTATIELSAPIEIDSIDEICSDDLDSYTVEIVLTGGVAPYFLDGNELASNEIVETFESGSIYNLFVEDSNGCNLNITGGKSCACENDPGTMLLDTLQGCITDTLIATFNEDAILDDNDLGLFVLHTSAADTLGAVLAITTDPSVIFIPGMLEGTVYYLSHIIGVSSGTGIDIADPCTQLSAGQPIVFNGPSEVDAGEDKLVCGFTTMLEGVSSESDILWTVLETPFGAFVDLEENELDSEITVNRAGEYVLQLESNNGFCTAYDTVSIEVIAPIDDLNFEKICTADGYYITFTITGGSGVYFVDGVPLEGNFYESEVMESGSQFYVELSDDGNCDTLAVGGLFSCLCDNDAGTMQTEEIVACEDDLVDISNLSNGDSVLAEGDEVYYVIHTESNDVLGDILGIYESSSMLEIGFTDLPFVEGETYYVSLVLATDEILDGNFDNPCIAVSLGTPLRWKAVDSISFTEDVEGCIGQTIEISVEATGEFPFEIIVSDGIGFNQSIMIDGESTSFEYLIAGSAELLIEIPMNTRCLSVGKGDMSISLLTLPEVLVEEGITVCNEMEFGSTVSFSDLIISGAEDGTWLFEAEEIEGELDFQGYIPGIYELEYVVTLEECALSASYFVEVVVEACECPVLEFEVMDVSCYGLSDGSIQLIETNGLTLEGYTIMIDGEVLDGLEVGGLSAGGYLIEVTDGEDCIESFEVRVEEPTAVQVTLGEDMDVEINDPVVVEAITNLIESEIGEVTWSSLEGVLAESGLLLNTSFSTDDVISIMITDQNGCSAMDEIMVRVLRSGYVIPNAINPNSTSGNDGFKIFNSGEIEKIKSMAIFDRWGNVIFEVSDIDPASEQAVWDGRFGGSRVANGVYVYRFVLLIGGKEEVIYGDLTVF